jgi:hypothetical protein|tara:strand:+ start:341 stop:1174 length:834 start_codon:yes stop_codon:yes gene_type:complete
MGLGMCSQRRIVHQPGLLCDTGKYAKVATTAALDNKTNFTVLQFLHVNGAEGMNPVGGTTFSMWDGTDGLYNLITGGDQFLITKGQSGGGISVNVGTVVLEQFGGNGNTVQDGGSTIAWAYTFDESAASNSSKLYFYTLDRGKSFDDENNTEANMGALGTSTEIRLGNMTTNGTNLSHAVTGDKIGKTAIWNSTLTAAEINKLVNYTTDGCMIYDVSGRAGAAGYTTLGVAQPNHEWQPTLNNADGSAVTQILDTGSTGGFDLSFVGSPKIATHGAY